MRIAMISYNMFVIREANGWKTNGDNAVLLLQNTSGKTWGLTQFGLTPREWSNEAGAIVDPLWKQLESELPTIEKVVFYVGSDGAERVIELAADHGLTPDRAVFVCCSCNARTKREVISSRGFSGSPILHAVCGGHDEMRNIYNNVLNHGNLSS